jgi:hypothetical protein
MRNLSQNVSLYRLAEILVEKEAESRKPDDDRKSLIKKDSAKRLKAVVEGLLDNMYPELDERIFTKILTESSKHPETKKLVEDGGRNIPAMQLFCYVILPCNGQEKVYGDVRIW